MKQMKLAGLVLVAGLVISLLVGQSMARLTGTDPGTDVWCMGIDGAEACVVSDGGLIPTTTNDAALGSASFYWSAIYVYDITAADDVSVGGDLAVTGSAEIVTSLIGPFPSIQTLGTGSTGDAGGVSNIIVADACGGIKRIQTYNLASDLMVADTNNTFTAPTSAYEGCIMDIMNIGSNNIKLPANTLFATAADSDLLLTSSDTVRVGSNGESWYQLGTVVVSQ